MSRCIEIGSIIKYFVVLLISLAFAMDLVTFLRPFERMQTQVEIDYMATEGNGRIQLFYKRNERDFSEGNSLVCDTSEEGIAKFEISGMNNEFRIDIDGINFFRIKSIKVIRNNRIQVINGDNWSDFYKAQHNVKSCFADSAVISYEVSGIDPYIVFDIGVESEGKEIPNYILVTIGTIICFVIVCVIESCVEKV